MEKQSKKSRNIVIWIGSHILILMSIASYTVRYRILRIRKV